MRLGTRYKPFTPTLRRQPRQLCSVRGCFRIPMTSTAHTLILRSSTVEPGSESGSTKAEPNLVACSRFVPLFAVLMTIAMEVSTPVPPGFCFSASERPNTRDERLVASSLRRLSRRNEGKIGRLHAGNPMRLVGGAMRSADRGSVPGRRRTTHACSSGECLHGSGSWAHGSVHLGSATHSVWHCNATARGCSFSRVGKETDRNDFLTTVQKTHSAPVGSAHNAESSSPSSWD